MVNEFLQQIRMKLANEAPKRIVFPEATDIRILGAASKLAKEGIIIPILLGNINVVNDIATERNINISQCEVLDPIRYEYFSEMVKIFMDCREMCDDERAASLLR